MPSPKIISAEEVIESFRKVKISDILITWSQKMADKKPQVVVNLETRFNPHYISEKDRKKTLKEPGGEEWLKRRDEQFNTKVQYLYLVTSTTNTVLPHVSSTLTPEGVQALIDDGVKVNIK